MMSRFTLLNFSFQLATAVLSMVLLIGCRDEPDASAPEATGLTEAILLDRAAVENLGLDLVVAGPRMLRLPLTLQGEVMLDERRSSYVPIRLAGVVQTISVDRGSVVEPGDLLGTFSSQEMADRIMTYVETERDFRYAMRTLEREKELREREISSEEKFLDVQRSYYASETAHAQALQRLRVLGFEEEDLHRFMERPDLKDMTRYELRSPIAGVVLARDLQLGSSVEPGANAFRVADLDHLWVRFKVPLAHLEQLAEGMPVRLFSETVGLEGEGKIELVDREADPRTRTVRVRANLANETGLWRPGMPVRVEVPGVEKPVDCAIPRAAVHAINDRPHVFARDSEKTVILRSVRLGRRDDAWIEVLEGLETGTTVVGENSFLVLATWETQTAE